MQEFLFGKSIRPRLLGSSHGNGQLCKGTRVRKSVVNLSSRSQVMAFGICIVTLFILVHMWRKLPVLLLHP